MSLTEDIKKLKTVADNVTVVDRTIEMTVNGQKCRCLISRLGNSPFNFMFTSLQTFAAAFFGTDPKGPTSSTWDVIYPHTEGVKLHETEGSLVVVVDFYLRGILLSMQMDPDNVGVYCVEVDSMEDFMSLAEWAGPTKKQKTSNE